MEVAHDLLQQPVAHTEHRYLSENLPPAKLSVWSELHGYDDQCISGGSGGAA